MSLAYATNQSNAELIEADAAPAFGDCIDLTFNNGQGDKSMAEVGLLGGLPGAPSDTTGGNARVQTKAVKLVSTAKSGEGLDGEWLAA